MHALAMIRATALFILQRVTSTQRQLCQQLQLLSSDGEQTSHWLDDLIGTGLHGHACVQLCEQTCMHVQARMSVCSHLKALKQAVQELLGIMLSAITPSPVPDCCLIK